MTDLDAIRARDAAAGDLDQWPPGEDPMLELREAMQAIVDRRALLAEVDALNEVVIALQQAVEREGAEVDRLTDDKADLYRQLAYAGSSSREGERARIHAAVESSDLGISVTDHALTRDDSREETVVCICGGWASPDSGIDSAQAWRVHLIEQARADVLAIIDRIDERLT
jgi:hypothetical protein